MAFGIDTTLADSKQMQSVSEATNVNVARINDRNGNPVEQRTYGQLKTTSREYYLGETDVYINGATNGQTGASVVTGSTRNSVNNDFQRVSETIQSFEPETAPAQSGQSSS